MISLFSEKSTGNIRETRVFQPPSHPKVLFLESCKCSDPGPAVILHPPGELDFMIS